MNREARKRWTDKEKLVGGGGGGRERERLYSRDPNTGHLETRNIRKPDVFDIQFSNG